MRASGGPAGVILAYMSGALRCAGWSLVAVAALVSGCVDTEPQCYDARTVLLTASEAVEGEVTFHSQRGESTYDLAVPDEAGELSEDTCSATLREVSVSEDAVHDLGPNDDLGAIVEFRCRMAQPLFQNFHALAQLVDVRLMESAEPFVGDSAFCQSCPELGDWCAHYSEPLVRAEVLDATGGPAGYPDFVTSDFLRTVRVELEMGRVADGTDGVCTENIELAASATFTVTASRYRDEGIQESCSN